jgi:hypothetical protein
MTGSVAKTEPITEGDDLADAKAQSAAMAKAKTDLKSATSRAAIGSRAVAVTPDLKDGHPVASVSFVKGGKLQTAIEPLD